MTIRNQGPLSRTVTQGPSLYCYSATPEASPAAVVGLVHGYFEHAGRYTHVMKAWADRGIATVAIDLRGHGRSGGRRGFCAQFGDFLDDTQELERLATHAKAPAFLFGHSFGGLVAASSALVRPSSWRGLLLSGPMFGIAVQAPRAKALAGEITSRLIPWMSLPSGIPSTDLTHDEAIARAYDEDPLVFHSVNARWFTEVTAAQKVALARAPSLALPLYMVMGTEDRLCSFDSARAFFEAAGSRDKTWDERQGLFHEVLNEPSWPALAAKMGDWILNHL